MERLLSEQDIAHDCQYRYRDAHVSGVGPGREIDVAGWCVTLRHFGGLEITDEEHQSSR